MTIVSILTCWFFATAEWRTVAFYQDARGYGVVKDYTTAYDVSTQIAFRQVGDEIICYVKETR